MIRFTLAICTWWITMTGIAAAQAPGGMSAAVEERSPLVETVAVPPKNSVEILPPTHTASTCGETSWSPYRRGS